MKMLYGTAASPDGSYVRAAIRKTSGGWEFSGARKWDVSSSFKNHLYLSRGTHLAVESHWARSLSADNEHFSLAAGSFLTAYTHFAHLQVHLDTLENNLLGVHPDDIFLCTLPLYLQASPPSSFLSLFRENDSCKIGIIINRKIAAVFTSPVSTESQLHGFLGRIERYWANTATELPFPQTACIFNDQKINPGARYSVRRITVPSTDSTVIKAIGVAFCQLEPDLPAFAGPTSASTQIHIRTAARTISYLLIALPAILFALLFLLSYQDMIRIKNYKNEYKNVLMNNQEIRELLKSGETLALKQLRMESAASNPTRWSSLLYTLGMKRPEKLYFERLGSDPVSGQKDKVRIALTGWAETEMVVTELIKNLNTFQFLSHVTLSTLERDEKQKNYCRFKIVCLMNISQN